MSKRMFTETIETTMTRLIVQGNERGITVRVMNHESEGEGADTLHLSHHEAVTMTQMLMRATAVGEPTTK